MRRLVLVISALVATAPLVVRAQDLPRLHITALGMHADKAVVTPNETFHLTIHVHVTERRDRLDELVLPALSNALDMGDERRRVAAPNGTDFYETMTLQAIAPGAASFTPAYLDAIDPSTGKAMRYSSPPVTVQVTAGQAIPLAQSVTGAARGAVLASLLFLAGAFAVALAIWWSLTGRRAAPPVPPAVAIVAPPDNPLPGIDPLTEALAAFRARRDDASLDALRAVLFALAGVAPGATLADALRSLGPLDPDLRRILAIAERGRFGPELERPLAANDLLEALDRYVRDRGAAV